MAEVKIPRGISRDEFLNQVRCGVFDAMRELMSTGTTNPSADFYGAIRDGTREAMRAVVSAGQLRSVISDSATERNAPAAEEGPKP
jgi:regulator of protease activity HflC (stomatin/prohibitin superfamily)